MSIEDEAAQPPHVGRLRAGPKTAAALYLLLIASAALALWVHQSPGALPGLEDAAPWAFLGFVVLFAVYRYALVRARKYSAFKAFFQIGTAVLFFTLLLAGGRVRDQAQEPRAPIEELEGLLRDPSPRVRVLAAELARYRPERFSYLKALARSLEDGSAEVRAEAHRSLVQITGEDLGPPEDKAAVKVWEEKFR